MSQDFKNNPNIKLGEVDLLESIEDTAAWIPLDSYLELEKEYDEAIELLNKIAMYGCGQDAYTSDFTNKVNGWVREYLKRVQK